MKIVFIVAGLLIVSSPVLAEEQTHGGGKPGKDEKHEAGSPLPLPIPNDYCANIADKARDARYQLQTASLADLQKKLEAETARLEEKRKAVEELLKKRDEEMKRAHRELIDIYAKMKPDAAATQLSLLDAETSAAVMRQLKPAGASAILTEMKPEIAAAIAAILAQPPDAETKDQGS